MVISGLLRRLWRQPLKPHPFRPLSTLTKYWADETLSQIDQGQDIDMGLVREGLQLFEELPRSATRTVLLATELHAGNVVRAEREPWPESILSRSTEIPPMMRPSIFSTVARDCDCIRIEPSEVLQISSELKPNVSRSGPSLAQPRNPATIGAMTILRRWREPLLHTAKNPPPFVGLSLKVSDPSTKPQDDGGYGTRLIPSLVAVAAEGRRWSRVRQVNWTRSTFGGRWFCTEPAGNNAGPLRK